MSETIENHWPINSPNALEIFYSKIEVDKYGSPTTRWEGRALARMATPFALSLAFRRDEYCQGLRCHRSVRASLSRVFDALNLIPHEERAAKGLNVFFGCYKPLDMVAGALSLHAWGAAISIGDGKEAVKILNPLFEEQGWRIMGDKRGIYLAAS